MEELRLEVLRQMTGLEDLTLSDDQFEALRRFVEFMREDTPRSAFLLTGSAGTGKTFMINLFSRLLRRGGYQVLLLAPTGRAAKVITRRTKRLAYTIHHHIYSPREGISGDIWFDLKPNKEEALTCYIVDEASMIGDRSEDGTGSLLSDLISYVYSNNEQRKLLIVGDPVQLPPVGHKLSPALDSRWLLRMGQITLTEAHLSEVKRQMADSLVLENAVLIRDAYLSEGENNPVLETGREVQPLENPWEAIETYLGYYQEGNPDRSVFISYSNGQASRINQAIRRQLHGVEEALIPSDLLMVVRNNYAWGDPKRFPFVANGEMGTVRATFPETYEEKYGLKWMDAEIEFMDSQGEIIVLYGKLVLDLLNSKLPQLDRQAMQPAFMARQQEYANLPMSQAAEQLRTDPYLNALQVKYGYCITGHKSQGGQWQNVVISFEPDYGQDMKAYIRWTYTVFTRAEERIFLLNCPFVT
ncbi:MAG: ATP-dependent endonuclease [Bacteroidetes bacterium]|nr:MAG: ATP-dependent endonuclease [Bacteroidota bacterium]